MEEPAESRKSKVSMMVNKSQIGFKSQRALGARSSLVAGTGMSTSRLRVRRQSFGFSGVAGIRPVERTSQLAMEYKRPPLIYLNTYQLEPHVTFHIPSVQKAAEELLDEYFTGHKYNIQESPSVALRVAGELMRRVKALPFNRYRIIVVVTIGQKRAQSYNNAIAFLWDHERDNYVDLQRETTTAFIQFNHIGQKR